MPQKKIVQDIVPSNRRSIREVSIERPTPARSAPEKRADRGVRVPLHLQQPALRSKEIAPPSQPPKLPRPVREKKSSGSGSGRRKWLLIGIAAVCVLAILYAASAILARATVVITPRSETVPVSGSFSATLNAQSPDLPFTIISTTTTQHVSEPATAGGVEQTYATGMALLINASSPSTQKIVAGTRLSDDRGLVYTTDSTVVIPAATSKTAGEVAVKVTASAPGPAYNSFLASLNGDLSIVAWNGTARAKIFYGRMTSDVTGGSSGPKMSVASSQLSAATSQLSSDLPASASIALQNMVPSGYILYPTAINTTLSLPTVEASGSTTADVSMTASAVGVVFKRSGLENMLAAKEIAQFPTDDYNVVGLDTLDFSLATGQSLSPTISSIKFNLGGSLDIVGAIDTAAVKSKLQGVSLSASNAVFGQYNSVISTARVSIVPFWIRTIPSSPARISVVIATTSYAGLTK